MPLPKPYLSPSQINQYLRCPQCYKFKYIDGIWAPATSAMVRGKAVHSGVEFNYRQKMDTHEDLPLNQILEFSAETFVSESVEADFKDDDSGKIKDSTMELLSMYHENIAPMIQPASVEQRVEVAFEGLDYTLLGYIDVIDQYGYIRDTKTTGKNPDDNIIHNNLQLIAYAVMHRTLQGRETGIVLDYLVATKTPKFVRFEKRVTDEETTRFLRIMQAVASAIETDLFLPNPTCFQCSTPKGFYYDLNMEVWK